MPSSSDIIIKRNKTSLLFLLPKQTRQTYRLQAVSLFLLLSVYDKQWSVSCEYTGPLVLPHQTEWSQRIEQSPVAWDAKSERRFMNNYQKAQWIVFTKASALSLQTVPFRSSFKTVYVFLEKGVLWISALQVSDKNRNRFELSHSVWTNPVYKTFWASLPAKQAITVGSSSVLMWSCDMIGVILIFQSLRQ